MVDEGKYLSLEQEHLSLKKELAQKDKQLRMCETPLNDCASTLHYMAAAFRGLQMLQAAFLSECEFERAATGCGRLIQGNLWQSLTGFLSS
jgi:hypothetical protein